MLDFTYQNITKMVFGRGKHKEIGKLLSPCAKKVLLHYGGGSIKNTGVYDDVVCSLKAEGIDISELGGVRPNPTIETVREGIEICRRDGIELILAVGGGSVIDSAKTIAAGVSYDGDPWDFFVGGARYNNVLPVACILTIPAAGSESSDGAVISNGDRKHAFSGPELRPVLSVCNPELYFTLPQNQISNGISDMMSHIMERYFSNTEHVELTSGLCEAALRTIMKNGLALKSNPHDYGAWSEISLAGTYAHNDMLGVGREQDWATHEMEHELSAVDCGVAHGAGLAVLTPHWMRYVYKENLDVFSNFVCNVMEVPCSEDKESMILEGINRLSNFYRKMGLSSTLKELGIKNPDCRDMARKSLENRESLGHFKVLYEEDIYNIYKSAMGD